MAFLEFLVSCSKLRMVVAAACLVVAGGCGSGYSGPTGTVRGTVTINGEPVPAGTGWRLSRTMGSRPPAKWALGEATNYPAPRAKRSPRLTYKVMISGAAPGAAAEADYDAMMEASAAGTLPAAPVAESVIPSKYASTATSGLSYTVNAGENTINIELQ
jgi:hypothetical protein